MKTKDNQKQPRLNIWFYLRRYKGPIFLYIIASLIAAAASVVNTIYLANLIEIITEPNFLMPAIYCMLVVIGVSIFQRICWYLTNVIYYKYSNKIMMNLNMDLSKQAFKLDSKTFNDHNTGSFVQRIIEDPATIVDNLATIIDVVADIITGIVILGYITFLNIWVSLCLIAIIIVAALIENKRLKVYRKNRLIIKEKNDKLHSLTTEIVRSEKDIKSLGLETKLYEVSKNYYEDYRSTRYKTDLKDVNLWSTRNFIIGIGTLLILILGIWLLDKGLMTLAAFMILYSNRDSLWSVVRGLGNISNILVRINVCHNRMFSLFDENEYVTEKFGTQHFDKLNGIIEFKNVSFTYKEYDYTESKNKKDKNKKLKTLKSKNTIFKKLSFIIEPNKTVAFVGKSGSGKSTILNLLSKMYEADSGKILIDGHDIKTLDKQTLRSTISLVNQFPYIFDMTIKENLLLAKSDATDEEINYTIKQSALKEFIDTLPNGINTKVGESGIKLSGGQKQRLAIARALLRNSSILIFDESTSSLDNFAQNNIKKTIDNLKGSSTIVIVAHRLSTIKDVDKIFFLDNGKIIDEGTFEELFNRNEKFKTMFLAENI